MKTPRGPSRDDGEPYEVEEYGSLAVGSVGHLSDKTRRKKKHPIGFAPQPVKRKRKK